MSSNVEPINDGTLKADRNRLGYMSINKAINVQRDPNSWYTPPDVIESAREVLDDIEFDPYSSELANKLVRANRIFTESNHSSNVKINHI